MTLRILEFRRDETGGSNVIVITSLPQTSFPGHRYRLQYKNRLEAPAWTDTGDAVPATGSPISLADTTATDAKQRFYRVVLVE